MTSTVKLQVLKAQELFGKTLYEKLSETPGNILFSPLTLQAILSVLINFAEEETKKELLSVLHLPDSAVEEYEKVLSHINNLTDIRFVSEGTLLIPSVCDIKPSLQDICRKFHIKVEQNADNNGSVISSLHFKSIWGKKFDTKDFNDTTPMKGTFKISQKQEIVISTMSNLSTYKTKNDDHLDATIVEIPFVNESVNMLLILPNDPYGIDELESELTDFDLEELTDHLQYSFIEILLPKFKVELSTNVRAGLEQMGLSDIFNSSVFEGDQSVAIDQVINKVYLEIDEEGPPTPPTGSSGGGGCCCQIIDSSVRVDHPFIFYIIANGASPYIIFQGKIVNPQADC